MPSFLGVLMFNLEHEDAFEFLEKQSDVSLDLIVTDLPYDSLDHHRNMKAPPTPPR